AEKELEKAERKLEKAEQNVKAVRPPPPCPSDMVLVPAGNFYFGSDKTDPLRNDAVEKVATMQPNGRFCINRFEAATTRKNFPATEVTWAEAQSSCLKEKERLCTQEEWERACKGSSHMGNFRFPYGNQYDSNKCNTERKDHATGKFVDRGIAKSGSFPNC